MIRTGSALATGNTTGTLSRLTKPIDITVRITGAHIGRPAKRFGTVGTTRDMPTAALGRSPTKNILGRSSARATASAATTHLHHGKYHCHSYNCKYKYGREDIHLESVWIWVPRFVVPDFEAVPKKEFIGGK